MDAEKAYCTILSFPDDDTDRVVWWYGPVYLDHSSNSTAPEVEVLLRTVGLGLNNKNPRFCTYKVPLPELSIVRIGSIWRGQKSLGKFDSTSIKAEFEFELTNYKPEFVKPFSSDDKGYIIPHNKYSFTYRTPQVRQSYISRIRLSTLNKITTLDGVSVLIPSLEVLTSMYTPTEMDIRRKLITQDFKELLKDYLHPKTSKVIHGDTYAIQLKAPKDVSNSVFLAHLSLNAVTRSRVSAIWTDLQTQSSDDRYPSIAPYHPGKLKISANGIWLNNNKTAFLALRVNAYSLPTEHKIQRTIIIYGKNDSTNDKTSNQKATRQSIVSPSLIITGDADPHSNAGIAKIRSQVSILAENEVKTPIIDDIIINTTSQSSGASRSSDKVTPTHISSGEPNSSSSSRRIAKLEHTEEIEDTEERNCIDQKQVISLVNNALLELQQSGLIKQVTYIDEDGNEFANFNLAHYPSTFVNQGTIGTWPLTFEGKPRKCLLVKLQLNNGKHLFLFEIERKSDNEAFSGLLFAFQLPSLTSSFILALMKSVAKNKGKYKKYSRGGTMKLLDITLDEHLVFTHALIEDSMTKKIESVLQKACKVLHS